LAQPVATKGNLINLKKSLALAKKGFELLDRKNNILIRETMSLVDDAGRIQSKIDETYAAAYTALQKANVTLGIVDNAAAAVPEEDGIGITYRSVMGVELPIVSLAEREMHNYYGYGDTNSMLDEAYDKFVEVKRLTVQLAQIENSVYRLAAGIKKTQKRANALKNIIIPRFESQLKIITEALEEKDREEFSRMKVIKKTVK
jgi:V/A-type H+-transporting ATPase subunit D